MRKIPLIVLAALASQVFVLGCSKSGSASVSCRFVEGRPYPEKAAFRYEGMLNVHGAECEVRLVVDGTEADRLVVQEGEDQRITLKCSGLSPGQHDFEVWTKIKNQSQKAMSGGVIIK